MAEDAGSTGAPAFRMETLATLPVFFKLRGKQVVIAGGDQPAVWKAELLAAAGADVRVFSEAPCSELLGLAQSPPDGSIELVPRRWTPTDFEHAALAIGAIESDDEAEAFCQAASDAGVPVNVIDKPAFCEFQFGTLVARSPLVIGISTDGAAPVFGQAVRARIEAVLPQGLRGWAEAAKTWRPAVQARNLDFRQRRRFWEEFAQRAFKAHESAPTIADRAACFDAVLGMKTAEGKGQLWLVGSGLGDPDSMTLGAIGALQSADIVLYDPEVSDAAVGLSRREAAKMMTPDRIDDLVRTLLGAIEEGKKVVWLGTGDPTRCQRWDVRKTHPRLAGVTTRIVPGLSRCPVCADVCRYPAQAGG